MPKSVLGNQADLYRNRRTIGRSWDISATAVEATLTLARPGEYLIRNLGPDPVNVRMFPATGGTFAVTTSDNVLPPMGAGEESSIPVTVTANRNNFPASQNVVHAICAAGNTATLRVTLVTKH
jgi:hypothetical protein